ncbi:RluA family pseudouridine synthase [Thermospira aquatica]|uniref:RluA family pseudouridine synthase n=1 Tax=Thermospira aquatica TaxID=2828656 RepID=A0AAX3BBQ1_9SPIR|nr:RluA family pseudouridine synthase [Thermospira aquatica]URA09653.1 RluA family pseudouridine synthase [Thermospira aquatica]
MQRFECLYPMLLRDFVAEQLGVSKKKAKELLDAKRVFVNKQVVWIATHQLRRGDRVEIHEEKKVGFDPSLLLLENEWILAVNKPAGMVVTEKTDSLEFQLRQWYKNRHLRAIHRLDKDTSGVVLFGKEQEVVDFYRTRWEEVVEKYYLAICQGVLPFKQKQLKDYLEQKLAVMDVVKLKEGDDYSLIGVRLHTGRKHQIRIQMAKIGYPLVGDRLYGPKKLKKRELRGASQQYLHAYEVRGILPSGENFRVVAPLPSEMKAFMKRHHLFDDVIWETECWFDTFIE